MATADQPTLQGFQSFVQNVMGIDAALFGPSGYNAPVILIAYNVALIIVNSDIALMPNPDKTLPSLYSLAVYNFAGDRVIRFAQDQPNAEVVPGSGDPGLPYFKFARKTFGLNQFVGGVIQSTSDEGTSEGLAVPDWVKDLTIRDLGQLKTPWGQEYLSIAQDFGPTVWGVS